MRLNIVVLISLCRKNYDEGFNSAGQNLNEGRNKGFMRNVCTLWHIPYQNRKNKRADLPFN